MLPKDRSSLRFCEQTRSAFRFLESEWGFKVAEELPTFVRYERYPVYIFVYHGRISFEIGVGAGALSEAHPAGDEYDLSAIVELSEPDVGKRYRSPAVDTEAAVGRALEKVALLLRKYGKEVAAGQDAAWRGLEAIGRARIQALGAESAAFQARPKAQVAFREGDYELAARLYSSIEASLSKVELRKLEIARKKLGG